MRVYAISFSNNPATDLRKLHRFEGVAVAKISKSGIYAKGRSIPPLSCPISACIIK